MSQRVDLVDPGPEGPMLLEHLQRLGFAVSARDVESLRAGCSAALLILAGDADGAVDLLRTLRRDPACATLPVILVGSPEHEDMSAGGVLALGADAYYPRPVPLDRVARKVEAYLAPPETHLRTSAAPTTGTHPTTDPASKTTDVPRTTDAPPPSDVPLAPRAVEDDVVEAAAEPPEIASDPDADAAQDPEVDVDEERPTTGVHPVSSLPSPASEKEDAEPEEGEESEDGEAPKREPTMNLDEDAPQKGKEGDPNWNPPERTMQLDQEAESEDADERVEVSAPDEREEVSGISPVADLPGEKSQVRASSHPPPASMVAPVVPSRPSQPPATPASVPMQAAPFSDRLRRLFMDADRRVFPTSAPLDIQFPASDETPDKLVPDEMLEVVSLPVEPLHEDPLEAFTYIGSLPGAPAGEQLSDPGPQWLSTPSGEHQLERSAELPPPGPSGTEVSSPSADMTGELPRGSAFVPPAEPVEKTGTRQSSRPERTGQRRIDDDEQDAVADHLTGFGERTDGGVGREGPLGGGDVVRLLWRCAEDPGDLTVELSIDGGADVSLGLRNGELVALDGPVASRVVADLVRLGRVSESPRNEDEAFALLERKVDAGLLGRFELDRMFRRAREAVLHDALESEGGRFSVRPRRHRLATGRLLVAGLRAILVEGARRRLDHARVRRMLGSGALRVQLLPGAAERIVDADLEPEVVGLIERHDGASLDALLSAAGPEEGLPGVVWALVSAGVLGVAPGEGDGVAADPTAAVRDAVTSAAALAEDGDYFAILGARPLASSRELEHAWRERRRELGDLNLSAHGLSDLEEARAAALSAIDEAWELLEDEGLRSSYVEALDLS